METTYCRAPTFGTTILLYMAQFRNKNTDTIMEQRLALAKALEMDPVTAPKTLTTVVDPIKEPEC